MCETINNSNNLIFNDCLIMKQILYVFLVACAFVGCSGEKEEALVGSIAGSVSDKMTGDPVATVKVRLSPGGQPIVTGSDGIFCFTELDAGTYTAIIHKDGYMESCENFSVVEGKRTPAYLLIERISEFLWTRIRWILGHRWM